MSIFIPTGDHLHPAPLASAYEPPSYKELGRIFGVCWQRVRQIEFRALEKMRLVLEQEAAAAGVSPDEWLQSGE